MLNYGVNSIQFWIDFGTDTCHLVVILQTMDMFCAFHTYHINISAIPALSHSDYMYNIWAYFIGKWRHWQWHDTWARGLPSNGTLLKIISTNQQRTSLGHFITILLDIVRVLSCVCGSKENILDQKSGEFWAEFEAKMIFSFAKPNHKINVVFKHIKCKVLGLSLICRNV